MENSETGSKLAYRRRKQLDSLYSQAELALLASVVCGAILILIMVDAATHTGLFTWAGIMVAVAVVRYAVIQAYRGRAHVDTNYDRWRFAFVGTLFASGAAWGTASY